MDSEKKQPKIWFNHEEREVFRQKNLEKPKRYNTEFLGSDSERTFKGSGLNRRNGWNSPKLTRFGNQHCFGHKPGLFGFTRVMDAENTFIWSSWLDKSLKEGMIKYTTNGSTMSSKFKQMDTRKRNGND